MLPQLSHEQNAYPGPRFCDIQVVRNKKEYKYISIHFLYKTHNCNYNYKLPLYITKLHLSTSCVVSLLGLTKFMTWWQLRVNTKMLKTIKKYHG